MRALRPARGPRRGAPTLAVALLLAACQPGGDRITVEVTFPQEKSAEPLDGRLILVLSQNPEGEPRSQVSPSSEST